MVKFYFGYFNWHGQMQANTWCEENGVPVGSFNHKALIFKVQLAKNLWDLPMSKLEEMYPRPTLPLE